MIMKLTDGRGLNYKADEYLTCTLSTVMNRDKLKEALVEESSQSSLIVVSPLQQLSWLQLCFDS